MFGSRSLKKLLVQTHYTRFHELQDIFELIKKELKLGVFSGKHYWPIQFFKSKFYFNSLHLTTPIIERGSNNRKQ